jgi:hypothetical protein
MVEPQLNRHVEQSLPDVSPDASIIQKDWDQYEQCILCHGRAEIDETQDGDLICHVCRAMLPRPAT